MPKKRKRAPGGGRPRSTGSSETPTVSFRVSAELHERATAVAADLGVPVGRLAREALADVVMPPGRTKLFDSTVAVQPPDASQVITRAIVDGKDISLLPTRPKRPR